MQEVAAWLVDNKGGVGNGFWVNAQDVMPPAPPSANIGMIFWLTDGTFNLPSDDPMWLAGVGEPNGGNGNCVKLSIISPTMFGLAMENCASHQYALCKVVMS